MSAIIAIVIAYLLGSLSASIILSKVMKTADPRTEGSGNAGATNILRLLGKKEALIVLLGDGFKGLLAVWIGYLLHVTPFMLGLVALAAVVGHVFPLYFGFKGGKGVATAFGATMGLSFLPGLLAIAVWAGIAFVTRYASLASLIAVVLAPIFLFIFAKAAFFIPAVLIAALVVWKHQDNIQRLKSGTESKISF